MTKFLYEGINVPIEEAHKTDLLEVVEKKARKLLKNNNIKISFLQRKSLDARKKKNIKYVISAVFEADDKFINKMNLKVYEPFVLEPIKQGNIPCKNPLIVGAGPAGLFAAYLLAKEGYKPYVIERGKKVEKREEDIFSFMDSGQLNTNSNIQFGEGGAGTFSDGKLFTRIKDPASFWVLSLLHEMGADASILYEAKPHIGSDVLKKIIPNLRNAIIQAGGVFLFESQLTDLVLDKNNKVKQVYINDKEKMDVDVLVLATGHSARDTYEMLFHRGLPLESKAFSVGYRIEHLQEDIDECMYGQGKKYIDLAAEYSLSHRALSGRSVYTFCMCPGGYVVNASSEENLLVTNGMSLSKRDGINANSALVASVDQKDFGSKHPLAGMVFQREIEKRAFIKGGGTYVAGVSSVNGFLNQEMERSNRVKPSIRPGYMFTDISDIYDKNIYNDISQAIYGMEKKIPCFTKGVLTACETRTSSPIRILRDEKRVALGFEGFYPCGEGAGYAGGIMSATIDGIKTAQAIIEKYKLKGDA